MRNAGLAAGASPFGEDVKEATVSNLKDAKSLESNEVKSDQSSKKPLKRIPLWLNTTGG